MRILDAKTAKEFRSFGANIVITAKANAPAAAGSLTRVRQAAGADALAAEFAYAVATTELSGTPVVVARTDFAAVRRLDSWWQVDAWPDPAVANACAAGQRAAQFVGNELRLR